LYGRQFVVNPRGGREKFQCESEMPWNSRQDASATQPQT
jgi:hypothetical protein